MTFRAHLSGVCATLALFAVCSPALAQDDVLVRVGGTPNYGPVLPVIAAEALGLFEAAGVDVEFTGYQGGAAGMEALAAGEADVINYFPPGLALAMDRGVAAKIVGAGTLTPRGWKIMTAADSEISKIEDLVGGTIGVTANGSTTDFFALWVAEQAGGEITRVPVGGGGLISNLLAGNVDAIVAYPPLSYQIGQSGDGAVLVDLGEAMEPNLPDVWIASQEIIDEHPDAVQNFLVGMYSAVAYMQANREWTVEFLMERNGFEREIAEEEYDNTILGLSKDGAIEENWVSSSLELGTLAGLEGLPAARDIFVDTFIPVTTITP